MDAEIVLETLHQVQVVIAAHVNPVLFVGVLAEEVEQLVVAGVLVLVEKILVVGGQNQAGGHGILAQGEGAGALANLLLAQHPGRFHFGQVLGGEVVGFLVLLLKGLGNGGRGEGSGGRGGGRHGQVRKQNRGSLRDFGGKAEFAAPHKLLL